MFVSDWCMFVYEPGPAECQARGLPEMDKRSVAGLWGDHEFKQKACLIVRRGGPVCPPAVSENNL